MTLHRHHNIAIIGAGNVGSVLGRILVQRGQKVVAVVSRSIASARRAGRYLRCSNASTSLASIPPTTDIVLITTPHGAVEEVAAALGDLQTLRFRSLSVCHASGMLTAEALEPLRRRGAAVFSFHPLQTFPREFEARDIVKSARSIFYGVDGSPRGIRKAKELARMLGGSIILIPPEMRTYYHAACVLASNHLTTMLAILDSMYRTLHVKGPGSTVVFKPIVAATLANIQRSSPAKALSGPVARGGTETVARHFESLARFSPQLIPYYAQLSLETVKLALAKGSINERQARALADVIRSYMDSSSQVMH